ncbi:hypothetical protein L210DRAFT_3567663 [Boletus edulis BED1]|uniref:Uncharacterized protein n=1 Tax=Boletus edulis BED1 TaxID=1328754 RepID=A0AAD4G778_BOLED|nr:hypothetical protein L210DRAFT_3567663 [Boletus edulis BED1]
MSDLTVLVSPTPLYPVKQNSLVFNLARRSQNDLTRPVMITLDGVDTNGPRSPVEVSNFDAAFLSPPRRTFRAARSPPPQRPASAPPLTVLPISSEVSLERVFSSSTPTDRCELSRPLPPLFRPTTFWRKTKRSGVAGASYSPSSHLIRRSTFIAAGLSLDKPEADLSALGVESRVQFIVLVPDYNPQ